jgi:hypothetical protein
MLTLKQNDEMLLFVAELGAAVLILSALVLPLNAGWAITNGASFNGIFLHPQALGIFLAMMGAVSFFVALKAPSLQRVLIVCGLAEWSMIYLTRARTGAIAIVLGGIVYVVEVLARGGKGGRIRFVSIPVITLTATGLLLATLLFPGIRNGLESFVQKGDQQLSSTAKDRAEALRTGSRGRQIFDVLEVIKEHPLFGYGFGVDPGSDIGMYYNGAQLWGIPLSAPIEQGFLPIATLAQIGIVGSLFVLSFLISIYGFTRLGSAEQAGLFATVIGVNLGEMIFYSFGGLGLIMWMVLVFFAVSGAAPRQYFGVLIR